MRGLNLTVFGKGQRGAVCLSALVEAGWTVRLAVGQPVPAEKPEAFRDRAQSLGIAFASPADPNSPEAIDTFRAVKPDIFVLAGYGFIMKAGAIAVPAMTCINLHGGRLPAQRGSSPMNWALIEGRDSFGLSIIQVDEGIDTGPVLGSREFFIGPDDTINDLHATALTAFPEMLLEVLTEIEAGMLKSRPQDPARAAYYPLRSPDDGLVLWDMLTARGVHNLVRALTRPYPCAYTYFNSRKVLIVRSSLNTTPFFGTPGKIYCLDGNRLLACAQDQCLWIEEAFFEDDGQPLASAVRRYDRLATVSRAAESFFKHQENMS